MANSAIEAATRRQFLMGAGAVLTAPAIVRASSLMPVRQLVVLPLRRECGLVWRLCIESVEWGLVAGRLTTVINGAVVTEKRAYEIVVEAAQKRWLSGVDRPGSPRWWFRQHLRAAAKRINRNA